MELKDLKKKLWKLFKFSWPYFLILVAVLIFFNPVWLRSYVPLPADIVVGSYYPWLDYKWGYPVGVPVKNPITSDAISFSYPMRTLAIDLMKKGEWPLWNPYILTGTPLLANFQSAPFTFTNIFYFLFENLTAWSIQIIAQHFLSALFIFLLLRFWGLGKRASILAGLVYAFSGFSIIWSQWNAHVLAAAYIPLLLLFIDRWFKNGKWYEGLSISITLALQLLSGYPQIVFYNFLAVFVLWIFRLKSTPKIFVKTTLLAVWILLGIGVAGVQILPGYELLTFSQRQQEKIPINWAFLSWEQVITFIAPDYFGNHATGNYWGPKNYTSNIGFVGIVAIILAGIGVLNFWKDYCVRTSFFIGLLALILALPNPVSTFLWQSNILGLQAGVFHRSLILFVLSISLLAGFGYESLVKKKPVFFKALIIPGLLIFLFMAWSLWFGIAKSDLLSSWRFLVGLRNLVIPTAAFFAIAFCLLLIKKKFLKTQALLFIIFVSIFELFYMGWKYTPFVPRHLVYPKTPVLEFLDAQAKPFRVEGGEVIPANLLIPFKLYTASGYDAVYPVTLAKLIAAINSNDISSSPQDRYGIIRNFESKIADLMNIKYLFIKKNNINTKQTKNLISFQEASVAVLERETSLPRAFLVYDWQLVQNDNQALYFLIKEDFPLDKKVIINTNDQVVSQKGKGHVEFTDISESESKIKVQTDISGLLFISETWYPGWKAYVDGKDTKIYKADYAFRAISVPPGEHEIRFIYKPDSFFNGVKISVVSIIVLAILGLVLRKWYRWAK